MGALVVALIAGIRIEERAQTRTPTRTRGAHRQEAGVEDGVTELVLIRQGSRQRQDRRLVAVIDIRQRTEGWRIRRTTRGRQRNAQQTAQQTGTARNPDTPPHVSAAQCPTYFGVAVTVTLTLGLVALLNCRTRSLPAGSGYWTILRGA